MGAPSSVILLLGPMRSGKTTFVKSLTGKGEVGIATSECKSYDAVVNGKVYRVIDTPGLDDSPRANLSVLKDIAMELSKLHKEGLSIGGVVYFHRITDLRLTGSARINIEIFEQICGANFLPRAAIATTRWDVISPQERQKFDGLHRNLEQKYRGLRTKFRKFEANKKNSAEDILLAVAGSSQGPQLKLEAEVIKSGLSTSSVRNTEAGKVIVREMNRSKCTIL